MQSSCTRPLPRHPRSLPVHTIQVTALLCTIWPIWASSLSQPRVPKTMHSIIVPAGNKGLPFFLISHAPRLTEMRKTFCPDEASNKYVIAFTLRSATVVHLINAPRVANPQPACYEARVNHNIIPKEEPPAPQCHPAALLEHCRKGIAAERVACWS